MSIIEHTYEKMLLEREVINWKNKDKQFELLKQKILIEIDLALDNNQSVETTIQKIKRQLLYFEWSNPLH